MGKMHTTIKKTSFRDICQKHNLGEREAQGFARFAQVDERVGSAMFLGVAVRYLDAIQVLEVIAEFIGQDYTLDTVAVNLLKEENTPLPKEEKAKEMIATMNRLWREDHLMRRETRDAFVRCQQWLSNNGFQYYQETETEKWRLINGTN